MKNPFIGTGVALITPFRKQETIDFSKLEPLINNIISNGVDYIVALGTTSEAATMTETERRALQDFIIETVAAFPSCWGLAAIILWPCATPLPTLISTV